MIEMSCHVIIFSSGVLFLICYYRTLRCIKWAYPGSISIQLGSWEGKKNRVGNLKGSDFNFFFKIFIFLDKTNCGKIMWENNVFFF
jgi:hypothetical protein